MASVWYLGLAKTRSISTAEWTAQSAAGTTKVWNEANGFSIPQGDFTAAQITYLRTVPGEFTVDAPNGPRPGFIPPSDGGLGMEDYVLKTELDPMVLTRLQDRTSEVAKYLDKQRMEFGSAVEGIPMLVYGASQESGDTGNSNTNTRWPTRLARRLGVTVTNRARGGTEMPDLYMEMVAPESSRYLAPGTKGIIHISGLMNDCVRKNTANTRAGYKSSLKAAIYRAMCNQVFTYSDAAWSYDANFANQGIAMTGLGFTTQLKTAYTVGAKATFTTPAPCRDLVLLTFNRSAEAFVSKGSDLKITVDGTVYNPQAVSQLVGRTASPFLVPAAGWAVPITGLSNAMHTIEIEALGNSGILIGGMGVLDRDNLPQITTSKPVYLDPARFPGSGSNAWIDEYRAQHDAAVAEVMAEMPNSGPAISVIDPLAYGWDPTKAIGYDNLHANDFGQAEAAESHIDVIGRLPFRQGMNRMTV